MKKRVSLQLAIGGVVIAACLWPIRFRTDPQFWFRAMDAVHLPLFAAVAAWFACRLRKRPAVPANAAQEPALATEGTERCARQEPCATSPERPGAATARRFLAAALFASLCAGAVEGLQAFSGRSANWGDFVNGVWGALLGAGGVAVWETTGKRWVRVGYAALTVLAVWLVAWPAVAEGRGMRWRTTHFPVLGDFESTAELRLWRPQGGIKGSPTRIRLTEDWASRGKRSLQVETGAGNWPGVNFNAGRQAWRGYDALALEVCWVEEGRGASNAESGPPEGGTTSQETNSAPGLELVVRVDADSANGGKPARFQRGVPIAPGLNELRIPLQDIAAGSGDTALDLATVHRLVLFLGDAQKTPHTLRIDHVRLED